MTSTIIGKGNITLYSKDIIELSGDKYNEIYLAGGAGGYSSTCADWLKFVTNFNKLLKKSTLKTIISFYPFKGSNKLKLNFIHGGSIYGGKSHFDTTYTPKWELIDVNIKFDTIA